MCNKTSFIQSISKKRQRMCGSSDYTFQPFSTLLFHLFSSVFTCLLSIFICFHPFLYDFICFSFVYTRFYSFPFVSTFFYLFPSISIKFCRFNSFPSDHLFSCVSIILCLYIFETTDSLYKEYHVLTWHKVSTHDIKNIM